MQVVETESAFCSSERLFHDFLSQTASHDDSINRGLAFLSRRMQKWYSFLKTCKEVVRVEVFS